MTDLYSRYQSLQKLASEFDDMTLFQKIEMAKVIRTNTEALINDLLLRIKELEEAQTPLEDMDMDALYERTIQMFLGYTQNSTPEDRRATLKSFHSIVDQMSKDVEDRIENMAVTEHG